MNKKLKKLKALDHLAENSVYDQLQTPIGKLTLIACDEGLSLILWDEPWVTKSFLEKTHALKNKPRHAHLLKAKKQLREYFAGKRKDFSVELSAAGTDFQQTAWQQLTQIPYGKTVSYQEQAIALGDKNKVRAVGSANGRNPISIIVPCHRVIAKDGSLSGFGGGLKVKQYLLEHEQNHL